MKPCHSLPSCANYLILNVGVRSDQFCQLTHKKPHVPHLGEPDSFGDIDPDNEGSKLRPRKKTPRPFCILGQGNLPYLSKSIDAVRRDLWRLHAGASFKPELFKPNSKGYLGSG